MASKKRILIFSPLPPMQSGVALYSHALATALSRAGLDTTVVVEQDCVLPERTYNTIHWKRFLYHRIDPSALPIYQLGNHPMHSYMYPFVYTHRGIVVLHDYILGHGRLPILQADYAPREVIDELAADLGEVQGNHYANMLNLKVAWHQLPFLTRLNRPIVATALVTISHNPDTVQTLRRENPGSEIRYIPMGLWDWTDPQHSGRSGTAVRRAAGIPDHAFLVGCFGAYSQNKQSDELLLAGKRLRDAGIPVYFVFGGYRSGHEVSHSAQALGIHDIVRTLQNLTRQEYWQWIRATDVCCSLRFPSVGECSLSLMELMAAARPVIVNRHRFNAYVPENVCVKIGNTGLAGSLARAIRFLYENPEMRRQLAARACEHIRREHGFETMIHSYRQLIQSVDCHDLPGNLNAEEIPRHLQPLSHRALREVHQRFHAPVPDFLNKELFTTFTGDHA